MSKNYFNISKTICYIITFLLSFFCGYYTLRVMELNINKYVAIILVTIEVYFLISTFYININDTFNKYTLIKVTQEKYTDIFEEYLLVCRDHKNRYKMLFSDGKEKKIQYLTLRIKTRSQNILDSCEEILKDNYFLDEYEKINILDIQNNIFQMLKSDSYSQYDLTYAEISFM